MIMIMIIGARAAAAESIDRRRTGHRVATVRISAKL